MKNPGPQIDLTKTKTMEEIEKHVILHYLERFHGSVHKVAFVLEVGPNTVYRRLRSWGIDPRIMKRRVA